MRRPAPLPAPPARAPREQEPGEQEPARAVLVVPRRMEPADAAGHVTPAGIGAGGVVASPAAPAAEPDGRAVPAPEDDGRVALAPERDNRAVPTPEGDGRVAPARADDDRPATADARAVWRAARARRRALRAEVHRFTARRRRRRRMLIGVAAAIVLLVAGSAGAAYSPLFAVRQIQIVGAHGLDVAAVRQALSGQLGRPLPLVDDAQVKAALVGFPLVESYTLQARPPHELLVRIVERTPVGVVEGEAGYTLVDAAGVALSTTPDAPAGQPVLTVRTGVGSPAFRAVGQVIRSLPADIRAQVTAASATTPDDVRLTLGGSRASVMWGSADDSAMKALMLAKVMAARPPADVTEYDVSSAPDAVVVR